MLETNSKPTTRLLDGPSRHRYQNIGTEQSSITMPGRSSVNLIVWHKLESVKIATRDTAERVTLAKSNKIEVNELRLRGEEYCRDAAMQDPRVGVSLRVGWPFARRYLHFYTGVCFAMLRGIK